MSTIKQREQIFRRGFNHGYLRAIEAMEGQLREMRAFLEDDLVKWRNIYINKVVEPPILDVCDEVWIRKKPFRSRRSKENGQESAATQSQPNPPKPIA